MGVETPADEHRDKALGCINEAIKNLAAIVIDQVAGWDEYTEGYFYGLQSALNDLIHVRTSLQ